MNKRNPRAASLKVRPPRRRHPVSYSLRTWIKAMAINYKAPKGEA